MIQKGCDRIEHAAGGLAGMASPMMLEEVTHTDIHGLHRLPKVSYFTAFLAKLDARKNDDSNRGAIQSLQEI